MSLQNEKFASFTRDLIHGEKREGDCSPDGLLSISKENYARLNYRRWAPTWDPKQKLKFKNQKPFVHTDRGYFGDPSFDSLFKGTGATAKVISPKLGLEVTGIQLSSLSDKQKDDLALLVEQKGVVAFRDQDFKDQSFEDLKSFARYFGPLHVHPTSGAPEGEPEFHMTFRKADKGEQKRLLARRLNNIAWHSDISYETQPPGVTFLAMLQTGLGGDTQFIDTIEAYDRLSPTIKTLIDKLQVVHSSRAQVAAGTMARKAPIDTIHPLVRYHPVLRKKSLYINGNFSNRILGLKLEESEALVSFLLQHLQTLLDAHIRPSWDDRTVVVWDNRRVIHTHTNDWDSDDIRTAFRLTPLAERPVSSEKEFQEWTPEKEEQMIKNTPKYLGLTPEEFYNEFYAGK